MTYLAILSLSEGRKAGFLAVAGVALGLLIVGLLAAFGVAEIIADSPLAYQVLRWCGVIYLFWLAWDGWKSGTDTALEAVNGVSRNAVFFSRGLITNLLNPKAAMFYIAVFPRFIDVSSHVTLQFVILTLVYVCVATIVHLSIVTLASSAGKFLTDPHRIVFVRRFLSILLAVVAVWFAITTRGSFE